MFQHFLKWLSTTQGMSRPLRFHFALLVCGVLFPVVAFSVVVVQQLARSEQYAAERRLLQSSHDLAASVDRELAATIRALKLLGQSENVEAGRLDMFHAEASRLISEDWLTIILTQADGEVVLNTSVPPTVRPLPPIVEPESLKKAIHDKVPVVGSVMRGPKGELAFPVRVPILNKQDGSLRFVLSVVMRPEALGDMVKGTQYAGEWTRTIIDSKGTIVARTREPQKYVGQSATPDFFKQIRSAYDSSYRATTLDGVKAFVSFSRATVSDWTATVVVPVDTIDGPSFRFLLTATVVGTALLLASGIGAFVLTRRISRGITDAAAAADSLAQGRRPGLITSPVAEIARLLMALRQSADLLEKRDRERRENLQRAREALAAAEDANRAKDDFLAMLGHELRNPLGPLRNSVHLLGRLLPQESDALAVREIIERQVTQMTRLVDELLDASRVSRGTILLQLSVLDVATLLRHVVSDYRPQFESIGLTLSLIVPEESLHIEGDRTRLAQCVGNLLHNALKFTPNGGNVTVSLYRNEDSADIEVTDTGPGIPPDLLPRLFEPFAQGPQSLARIQGGLGLGLALVRGLTKLHGGEISARSRGIGLGATFIMRLPLTTKHLEPTVDEGPHKSARVPPQRVLVVEDLPDAARSLKMLLALDGHLVDTAPTAANALERAPGLQPNVVICDIGLPDMDGYDLCRRLRALPELQSARFIALTGYGQASDVSRALEAGFDLHLTKPVDIASLHDALRPPASAPSEVSTQNTLAATQ